MIEIFIDNYSGYIKNKNKMNSEWDAKTDIFAQNVSKQWKEKIGAYKKEK